MKPLLYGLLAIGVSMPFAGFPSELARALGLDMAAYDNRYLIRKDRILYYGQPTLLAFDADDAVADADLAEIVCRIDFRPAEDVVPTVDRIAGCEVSTDVDAERQISEALRRGARAFRFPKGYLSTMGGQALRKKIRMLENSVFCAESACSNGIFTADWASLDSRPVPTWWRDAKFGIFIHWGLYSVPAYAPTDAEHVSKCYSEWYLGRLVYGEKCFVDHHRENYGKSPYVNFVARFTASRFNPERWADIFRKAGARYVVLTAKHHDGYALWPSAQCPYFNSVASGPGRDLCEEIGKAVRSAGLRMGYYYSLCEYANPLYVASGAAGTERWATNVVLPQLKELANRYRADIIWADGEVGRLSREWHSEEFLAWLYNQSDVREHVVVNDRWGLGTRGKHGGFLCTEYGEGTEGSENHPWEECRGIGRSFGYNRLEGEKDYLSAEELIRVLVRTASRGGNLLLNVGPDAEGEIPPPMVSRLQEMGRWLERHGEAIYGTVRGPVVTAGGRVVSTQKGERIYLFALDENVTSVEFVLDGRPRRFDFQSATEPVRVIAFDR